MHNRTQDKIKTLKETNDDLQSKVSASETKIQTMKIDEVNKLRSQIEFEVNSQSRSPTLSQHESSTQNYHQQNY